MGITFNIEAYRYISTLSTVRVCEVRTPIPLRVLDYLKQKEEFLIIFTNSSATITKKINFEKWGY